MPIVTISAGTTNYIRLSVRGDVGQISCTTRLASSGVDPVNADGANSSIALDQLQTLLALVTPGTTTVRVDGTQVASAANGWTDEEGDNFSIRLGGEGTPPAACMAKNMRDVIVLTDTLTNDDIAELEAYGASRIPA